ncbi:4'-phosphopantetheinyl transferase superfamily protein [Cellulomonas sp. Marseille-Q8402]
MPADRPLLRLRHAEVRPAAGLAAALNPDERDRVARAAPADRDAVAAAVLLARLAVAEACGVDPSAVRVRRRCPRCGSAAHGAPWAQRADGGAVPHLSLTRTADLVVVALAAGPVGVDVERAVGRPDVAGVVLAADERPAAGPHGVLLSWARKEAVLKAAGTGLGVDPRTLEVSDAQGRPHVTATGPAGAPPGTRWWLTDLDLGPGHVGALAAAVEPGATPVLDVGRA